jgi:hypothetical protein
MGREATHEAESDSVFLGRVAIPDPTDAAQRRERARAHVIDSAGEDHAYAQSFQQPTGRASSDAP